MPGFPVEEFWEIICWMWFNSSYICLGPIGLISMQFQIVGLEYHTGESSVPPDYFNNNDTSKT